MKTLKIYFAALFLLVAILLSSCSGGISPIKSQKSDLNIVAKVNGEPIYLEEVRYLAFNYANDLKAKYGEDIFSEEHSDEYINKLKEQVESAMLLNATFISICKKYGVDTEKKNTEKKVTEYINNFAEQIGGKDAYISQLTANAMTDHLLRYILSIEFSKEALRQTLCDEGLIDDSDEKAREIIESDEFIRTLHVYIGNDAGENIESNRKKAETVLSELKSGEPFTRMIGRYSEDVYMTTTDGYYFTRGEYEKAYEDAAFDLELNEYSGIVEGENGFYIILRLEKEDSYIEKNFENLKDRYLFVKYESIIKDCVAEAVVEYSEFGKTVNIAELAGVE